MTNPAIAVVYARSLSEALLKRAALFHTGPIFENIVDYLAGIGVFIGGWVAGIILEWLLWYLLMFNWRRLLCKSPKDASDKKKEDDKLWAKPYNSHDESAKKDGILPMPAGVIQTRVNAINRSIYASTAAPRLVERQPYFMAIGDPAGTTPVPFKAVPQEPTTYTDSKRWHGHERTRYESYVRLVVLSVRVMCVIFGVGLGFQAAGVNFFSLAASLGIISLCFTYGAAPMMTNILSALYMYGTDKLEMGDYVRAGGVQGIITAFRVQWTEITDDLNPMQGRQIHQIPNRILMEGLISVFPQGPPLEVIQKYFQDLTLANAARDKLGLPPIKPIEFKLPADIV